MPKLKTRKSVAKRFKLSKTGKVIPYGSSNTSHIMSKKNARRRRRLRNPVPLEGATAKSMRTYMGK